MQYALQTLWYDRQRYIPGVLAVAFSCLLIALQCGLLLGLFSITSIPIDNSRADIWVTHPKVPSVDLGRPIPEAWMSYITNPEIERVEPFMEGFGYWDKPTGGTELVLIIGSRLEPNSLGAVKQLTPTLRAMLSEVGAVVVDDGEFDRLGIEKVGDVAEVFGHRLRIVGTVHGLRSLAGPYVFCSLETAKTLLRPPPDQTTFLLAKCANPADANRIVDDLNKVDPVTHKRPYERKVSVLTAEQFSFNSRWHWLTKTKAGIALGFAALLGLLVGAVVTSQTLYAATAAAIKEYAVLRAMGIPRWRMYLAVISQSFWVGIAGIALSVPAILAVASIGSDLGAKVILPWWLWVGAVSITLCMAMISGLFALRSLRSIEPVTLLR
ncbi:MAG TPA: ABC transporter permease [Gemmataceae bacterium]|jgi:putative ABC transport system permease protein|nr:ABC transporter permease [Gemmataceae bacterium]